MKLLHTRTHIHKRYVLCATVQSSAYCYMRHTVQAYCHTNPHNKNLPNWCHGFLRKHRRFCDCYLNCDSTYFAYNSNHLGWTKRDRTEKKIIKCQILQRMKTHHSNAKLHQTTPTNQFRLQRTLKSKVSECQQILRWLLRFRSAENFQVIRWKKDKIMQKPVTQLCVFLIVDHHDCQHLIIRVVIAAHHTQRLCNGCCGANWLALFFDYLLLVKSNIGHTSYHVFYATHQMMIKAKAFTFSAVAGKKIDYITGHPDGLADIILYIIYRMDVQMCVACKSKIENAAQLKETTCLHTILCIARSFAQKYTLTLT